MNILAWNCRGLGKPRAVRELTELVRLNRRKIVGLFEVKIDSSRVHQIRQRLKFKNGLVIDPRGIAGGLSLWWTKKLTFSSEAILIAT